MKTFNLLLVFAMFIIVLSCVEKRKSFDSNEWKNWSESEEMPSERWLMYKDLLKKYQFIGIGKDSVLNMLGKPNIFNQYEFQYNLGYSNKGGIDPSTMIIEFNNDTVVDIRVLLE